MSKPDPLFSKASQEFVWNMRVRNQSGNIITLFAIFLPIILGFFLLVIDGGLLQIRKAELSTVAHSAAEYGLSQVADKIVELAEIHCSENCKNSDPKSYLNQNDIYILTHQPFTSQIENSVQNFILTNSKTSSLTTSQITIHYPYNLNNPTKNLQLYISLTDPIDLQFGKIFSLQPKNITTKSLVKISL